MAFATTTPYTIVPGAAPVQIAAINLNRKALIVQVQGTIGVYLAGGVSMSTPLMPPAAGVGIFYPGNQTPPSTYVDGTLNGPLWASNPAGVAGNAVVVVQEDA